MKVFIYSLEKILFEGDAEVVSLPTPRGEISILENHVPVVTPLSKGVVKLRKGSGFDEQSHRFDIQEGFAQINSREIILLV